MPISTYPFSGELINKIKKIEFGKDWPVVYILENGDEMYIGETMSASHRFKQHYDNPKRKRLTKAHLIADEEYNKSATLDIESQLIQYMIADQRFKLQNGNGGLANHSYFDREKYIAKFEIIWEELQKLGLANKDLLDLRNTDIFKYSPYKSLTSEQVDIVGTIKNELINNESKTFIVNGEPGTGKSVLATYLIKNLSQSKDTKNLKIALVIPQSGLRNTLKKVFSKIKGLNSNMVIGPSNVVGEYFDLLIVDEAHRLRRRVNLSRYGPFDKANKFYGLGNEGTQLDWIMNASRSQVLLYDSNQSVVPGDIRSEMLKVLNTKQFTLTSQLRVLGGNDYIDFINNLLNLKPINKNNFGNYELRYFKDISKMVEAIKNKNKKHGLARVVAGYAWTWETKKGGEYDIDLDGLKLKWNSTNIDWVNSPNAINEVGCIHTVQGYDLNFVGVIIGPELTYDPIFKKLIVHKDKYMDFNGKRTIESSEELEKYIINIYKTLLTRGINGTFIHAVDKELEKYMISKIEYSKDI